MPPPHTRARLSGFASALAARLPGTWHSEIESYPAFEDQFPVAERIWDFGPSQSAPLDVHLEHAAVLHGFDGQQLYVMARPRCPHQFLVAPLQPDGFRPHHFAGVDEPCGISVPRDPVRAAAAVTRRVMPRFQRALDAVRDNARIRPEPPHRPPAAKADRTLTLVWYPDGAVGAPSASVPKEMRGTLFGCRFQYDPHQAAFVLPTSYSPAERALLVQLATQRLMAEGIGVNFRRAAPPAPRPPRPAAATLGAPPSAGQPSAPRR
ncbi:hypothetical protein AQI95_29205 [Streptomyces yokosukanensis]|uniref:Uncharacterized protein n=1 Tax=Streptomyces yokosukanensis TaxID=67386 RepID=A0A101NZH3_9ACTN|nr:hypothetical protein [Streptomyces yokosukanensis]KUN02150.1 hypothetical protein AQI95_29205 [Streptomyces yokosukanensis]